MPAKYNSPKRELGRGGIFRQEFKEHLDDYYKVHFIHKNLKWSVENKIIMIVL